MSSKVKELPDLDQAPIPGPSKQKSSPSPAFQPGSHVVAEYEGEYFLCEVTQNQEDVAKGYTRLSYTTIKGKNSFAWGEKPDLMITLNEDILVKDVIPQPINSRGHFGLENKDLIAVLKKMVMVYFSSLLNLFFCSNSKFKLKLKLKLKLKFKLKFEQINLIRKRNRP